MDKILYIFPGWEESCQDESYRRLAVLAQAKGYTVVPKEVDWKKPLSGQTCDIPPDAVVFGFSLGAILAWLVAQEHPCCLLILASMTPFYSFQRRDLKQVFIELNGKEFVEDMARTVKPANRAAKQIIMYGEKEDEPGDIIVPNTDHEINEAYLKEIEKIL